ncbi:MAG: TVP38/TMEM64 family protein [Candidatus Aminicenantes bacterium]|jgi:uncharacterized membrane protein YdjX (TVP38/TMEM64 family)|nr:TVP38/TMEM64 family protein [Candidatus Aminicenantes bacterium]
MMPEAGQKKPSLFKPIALFVMLLAFIVLARVFNLGSRIGELRAWILSLGAWGPLVYIGIYAVAVVLAIPGSAITIVGGVLFGSITGIAVVSIGSTIGAALAFLVSRHIARDSIARRFEKNAKFQSLDRLTKDQGAIIVAITRLVPLFPFNLLNYGFGLTHVRFWTYVFWSWLCMLPGTVLYVVGSDAVSTAIAQKKIPWPLVIILAIALVLITILVRQARKKLKEKEGGHARI